MRGEFWLASFCQNEAKIGFVLEVRRSSGYEKRVEIARFGGSRQGRKAVEGIEMWG